MSYSSLEPVNARDAAMPLHGATVTCDKFALAQRSAKHTSDTSVSCIVATGPWCAYTALVQTHRHTQPSFFDAPSAKTFLEGRL